MATAGSLLADIRLLFGDPDREYISDTVGLEWLDMAQERFCDEVYALDEIKDYTVTGRVVRYDLPDNAIIADGVMWFKDVTRRLDPVQVSEMERIQSSFRDALGNPRTYTVLRRQLVLDRAPSGSSATALASGTALIGATTIGLTAASGTFRSRGFVKNVTSGEVIEFLQVASTTITGCTRGVHNTTAASVASGDQFQEIDMQLRYRRRSATLTATTSSPDIPSVWHKYLEKYVLYRAWLARGDSRKAEVAYSEFQELEGRAKERIGRRMNEPAYIQDRRRTRRDWPWY